jgi:hypothetical protein
MKTNHRRGFKDKRDPNAVFTHYQLLGSPVTLALADRKISAGATTGDHTNGKRGIARDKAGAKKYRASRSRFHEGMALKRLIKNSRCQQEDNELTIDG